MLRNQPFYLHLYCAKNELTSPPEFKPNLHLRALPSLGKRGDGGEFTFFTNNI